MSNCVGLSMQVQPPILWLYCNCFHFLPIKCDKCFLLPIIYKFLCSLGWWFFHSKHSDDPLSPLSTQCCYQENVPKSFTTASLSKLSRMVRVCTHGDGILNEVLGLKKSYFMVFLTSPVYLDIMMFQVVFWLFFFFAASLILKGGKKDVLFILCFFTDYSVAFVSLKKKNWKNEEPIWPSSNVIFCKYNFHWQS